MFLLDNFLKNSQAHYHYKNYSKGQMIYQSGDLCSHLDYILSGKATIQHFTYEGQVMTLASFHKDQTLGTSRLFSDNHHYPMSIIAEEDIKLLRIEKMKSSNFVKSMKTSSNGY